MYKSHEIKHDIIRNVKNIIFVNHKHRLDVYNLLVEVNIASGQAIKFPFGRYVFFQNSSIRILFLYYIFIVFLVTVKTKLTTAPTNVSCFCIKKTK